jgi:hypothetical protein
MTDKQVTVGGKSIARPVLRRVFIRTRDTAAAPTQEWLDEMLGELYREEGVQGVVFNTVITIPPQPRGLLGGGLITSGSAEYRAIFTIWT